MSHRATPGMNLALVSVVGRAGLHLGAVRGGGGGVGIVGALGGSGSCGICGGGGITTSTTATNTIGGRGVSRIKAGLWVVMFPNPYFW